MSVLINASTSTGLVQSADTSGEIELQSNGTTALKVNTNEGIQILNCLGVGNATPSTSGAGITFPATASASSDANTLDDYEEGTFTPTLFGATTAGTTTYGNQWGIYTKIGRQVTVSVYITATAATGTGELRIGGLPFAFSGGNTLYVTAPYVTQLNWSGGSYLSIVSRSNETNVEMQCLSDDGGASNQSITNETQGIGFTLTYFV